MAESRTTVLVVDDDPDLRQHLRTALEETHRVLTAATGDDALTKADDADVMLLDRRLPDSSGREVLRRVREGGNRLPVAMVTAVEPDFDILEMGFDTYLQKPVAGDEVRSVVRSLVRRATYDDRVREYYSVVSKVAALEVEKSPDELETSDEYQRLLDRLETARAEAGAILDETIEHGEVTHLLATLGD